MSLKWQCTLQLLRELSQAGLTAPIEVYSYVLMDMEQFGLVSHEVALLQNLGIQGGQTGETFAASAVASFRVLLKLL